MLLYPSVLLYRLTTRRRAMSLIPVRRCQCICSPTSNRLPSSDPNLSISDEKGRDPLQYRRSSRTCHVNVRIRSRQPNDEHDARSSSHYRLFGRTGRPAMANGLRGLGAWRGGVSVSIVIPLFGRRRSLPRLFT